MRPDPARPHDAGDERLGFSPQADGDHRLRGNTDRADVGRRAHGVRRSRRRGLYLETGGGTGPARHDRPGLAPQRTRPEIPAVTEPRPIAVTKPTPPLGQLGRYRLI